MNHRICNAKLQTYLSTLDEKEREYVTKIADNTIFISTERMVEKVRNGLNKFKADNPKYNLYVPSGKIGSEHYLLLQLKDELHPIEVIYGSQKVNNDYPVLIVDDAIYSSTNICGHIDTLRYETGMKNKFVVVVAVISSQNVSLVEDSEYFQAEVIADMELSHLLPERLFDDYDFDYFFKHFGCETECMVPLIFEHKIANEFGTYQFYHEIVGEPVSRAVIDIITQEDVQAFISSF